MWRNLKCTREKRHEAEKAQGRKARGRKHPREKRHEGEKARGKRYGREMASGEMAEGEARKKAPLERHCLGIFQCHFHGAFTAIQKNP